MQKLDNLFHHIPQFSYIQRPYNRPPEVEIISEAIMLWENCSYSINLGNKNWCYFHSYPSGDTTTVIILANDKKKFTRKITFTTIVIAQKNLRLILLLIYQRSNYGCHNFRSIAKCRL